MAWRSRDVTGRAGQVQQVCLEHEQAMLGQAKGRGRLGWGEESSWLAGMVLEGSGGFWRVLEGSGGSGGFWRVLEGSGGLQDDSCGSGGVVEVLVGLTGSEGLRVVWSGCWIGLRRVSRGSGWFGAACCRLGFSVADGGTWAFFVDGGLGIRGTCRTEATRKVLIWNKLR